jgi:glucose-1-phosphate adenylyltransferase
MDYGPMVAFHVEQNADITVGVIEVPRERAREFGVLTTDDDNRVVEFNEKPEHPKPMPGRDNVALASMGIYVFDLQFLDDILRADAADDSSHHDFGKDVVPNSIDEWRVFAYSFLDVKTRAQSYWRDVGNVDAYFEANMELVHVRPELNIYDERWPIWTYQEQLPPAKFVLDDVDRVGMAVNSMVSGGCIISGAKVSSSLLFSSVTVDARSVLRRAVVLPGVRIGEGCRVTNAVIDEHCVLPDGMVIGENPAEDAEKYHVTGKGVVLVTPDMLGQRMRGV